MTKSGFLSVIEFQNHLWYMYILRNSTVLVIKYVNVCKNTLLHIIAAIFSGLYEELGERDIMTENSWLCTKKGKKNSSSFWFI